MPALEQVQALAPALVLAWALVLEQVRAPSRALALEQVPLQAGGGAAAALVLALAPVRPRGPALDLVDCGVVAVARRYHVAAVARRYRYYAVEANCLRWTVVAEARCDRQRLGRRLACRWCSRQAPRAGKPVGNRSAHSASGATDKPMLCRRIKAR